MRIDTAGQAPDAHAPGPQFSPTQDGRLGAGFGAGAGAGAGEGEGAGDGDGDDGVCGTTGPAGAAPEAPPGDAGVVFCGFGRGSAGSVPTDRTAGTLTLTAFVGVTTTAPTAASLSPPVPTT